MIDKSAAVRIEGSPDRNLWLQRIQRGLICVSTPTLLELGYSARTAADWAVNTRGALVSLMPLVYATPGSERRAVELQGLAALHGQHRAPSIPDLLIAALAEERGLTVLHLDHDFELIAHFTGQPTQRIRVA
ncbi:MAG: PIN domain nuclease [Bifidobacteriaceae bacterium]|nr:PIN domain nuclease [Bifidobacteriaceae bacterium]